MDNSHEQESPKHDRNSSEGRHQIWTPCEKQNKGTQCALLYQTSWEDCHHCASAVRKPPELLAFLYFIPYLLAPSYRTNKQCTDGNERYNLTALLMLDVHHTPLISGKNVKVNFSYCLRVDGIISARDVDRARYKSTSDWRMEAMIICRSKAKYG